MTAMPMLNMPHEHHTESGGARRSNMRANVVIIGADRTGPDMAHVLPELAIPPVSVVEKDRTWASFRAWPESMHFISPFVPGIAFGLIDRNAMNCGVSPCFYRRRRDLSGIAEATHLEQAVNAFELSVITNVDIRGFDPDGQNIGPHSTGSKQCASFAFWAAGQIRNPSNDGSAAPRKLAS